MTSARLLLDCKRLCLHSIYGILLPIDLNLQSRDKRPRWPLENT